MLRDQNAAGLITVWVKLSEVIYALILIRMMGHLETTRWIEYPEKKNIYCRYEFYFIFHKYLTQIKQKFVNTYVNVFYNRINSFVQFTNKQW